MKIEKKLTTLAEQVLSQVDNVGYQLDAIGVENQINRHTLIAMAMFGQKRFEGEMDSISAKVARLESIGDSVQRYLKSGLDVALFPANYAIDRVQSLGKNA